MNKKEMQRVNAFLKDLISKPKRYRRPTDDDGGFQFTIDVMDIADLINEFVKDVTELNGGHEACRKILEEEDE